MSFFWPVIILLENLEKEYHRLSFLVDDTNVHLKQELQVSIQAGEIVGVLYDKILAQYKDPNNPESQKALNNLCVRLVFCLYAEDAGIFGTKDMFHDYMAQFSAGEFREKLIKLFHILDQKPKDRDPYEDEKLLAFPYVNGGMFAGDIEIPRINEEIRSLILQRASDNFDWSPIRPRLHYGKSMIFRSISKALIFYQSDSRLVFHSETNGSSTRTTPSALSPECAHRST